MFSICNDEISKCDTICTVLLYSGHETDPLPSETSDTSSEESKSRKFYPTAIAMYSNTISTSISFSALCKERQKIIFWKKKYKSTI